MTPPTPPARAVASPGDVAGVEEGATVEVSPTPPVAPGPTGAELQAEGAEAVLAADVAVHRSYSSLVREAVSDMATADGIWGPSQFTAEDVRVVVELTYPDARPHHVNVLPATMRALAREGRIRPTGWTTANRPEARGRALRLWRVTP